MEPSSERSGLLSVVINSYNRRDLLTRSVASIFRFMRPLPKEVLVVDDGSTDGSRQWLQEQIESGLMPGLRMLLPHERLGFAGGVNAGVLQTSAPYVCLFETDNELLDNALWQAVDYLEANARVAAVGFRVRRADGQFIGNSMGAPHPVAFVLGQQLADRIGLEKPRSSTARDVLFTSPIVLRRDALARTGLMDSQRFPFCDSDVEWCRRIRDAGYELHALEDLVVIHDQGTSPSEFSRKRTLDFHRSRTEYFRRYLPQFFPAIRAGVLARHVVELAILGAGWGVGKVPKERVLTRIELLQKWSRAYRS